MVALIVWKMDLQLPMQSVPITTDIVNLNPTQWLSAGLWFSPCTPVSSTNKTDHHDIQNVTELLLKVVLNTINPTNQPYSLQQNLFL